MNRCSRILAGSAAAAALLALPAQAQQENVQLLAHLDDYAQYNDVWGYDASGREFAIIGTTTGTSIVDATNPSAPFEVGFIPGPSSTWRDIDSYGSYLYIVTEGSGTGTGLQVVSMANPDNPVLVATYTATFATAHTLYIDQATRRLYANGTRTAAGASRGMRILSLANPAAPVEVGSFTDFYIHDLHVQNGIAYAAALDLGIKILDVSVPSDVRVLATRTYPGAFTHNTWVSPDDRWLATTDETTGGHLRIWDLQNFQNLVEVGSFALPGDIVHNAYWLGNRIHLSHYTAGLQIVDVSSVQSPVRVGYYDTWPGTSGGFNGAWSVYPYTPSGTIYISDISTGLYIVRFDPNAGILEGTIRDASTLQPIAGATARLRETSQQAASDSSGFYRMSVTAGSYTVDFSAFGYANDSRSVSIGAGARIVADASLAPLPRGSIAGTVRRRTSGSPLALVRVDLVEAGRSTLTDGLGRYAFSDVPAGNRLVTADALPYAPARETVSVSAGGAATLDFELRDCLFFDDMEIDRGFTVGDPTDTATTGIWVRADPVGTAGGTVQPEDDHTPPPGVTCYVTGNGTPGGPVGENDVDGGKTTLYTPILDLSGFAEPVVSYWRWYYRTDYLHGDLDQFHVEISNDGGSTWATLEDVDGSFPQWTLVEVAVSEILAPTSQVRLRFIASDFGQGSIVEAAIDDFRVYDALEPPAVRLAAVGPAEGSELGGDLVRLSGEHFTTPSDTLVTFAGAAATDVRVLTPKEMTVHAPAGAGIADVTVSNANGSATLAGAYRYLPPLDAARLGNVGVARGARDNVLTINGSIGDAQRIVTVGVGQPITVHLASPSSRASSRFAVYVWGRIASPATVTPLPFGLGRSVLPMPPSGGSPMPVRILSNLGNESILGTPTSVPQPAPVDLARLPAGRPSPLEVTLQGLIRDDASGSDRGVSITNAVALRVE